MNRQTTSFTAVNFYKNNSRTLRTIFVVWKTAHTFGIFCQFRWAQSWCYPIFKLSMPKFGMSISHPMFLGLFLGLWKLDWNLASWWTKIIQNVIQRNVAGQLWTTMRGTSKMQHGPSVYINATGGSPAIRVRVKSRVRVRVFGCSGSRLNPDSKKKTILVTLFVTKETGIYRR